MNSLKFTTLLSIIGCSLIGAPGIAVAAEGIAVAAEDNAPLPDKERIKFEQKVSAAERDLKNVDSKNRSAASSAYNERADAYLHLRQYQKAFDDADHAVTLDPRDSAFLCTRAEARLKLGQVAMALLDFNESIHQDPGNGEAYYGRAQTQDKLGDKTLAATDFAKAKSLGYVEGQEVDFGPYMADMQRRIKRHWFPPKGAESKHITVTFSILRGGELSNLRLEKSCGIDAADHAARKAVEDAAPFRPLPLGAPKKVDIQFTLDYNVFNGSGFNGSSLSRSGARIVKPGAITTTDWSKIEIERLKTLGDMEKAKGKDDPALVTALLSLGDCYREQGQYVHAQAQYTRAQEILVKSGADKKLEAVKVLSRLAGAYTDEAKPAQAESLYKQAMEIIEQSGKPPTDDSQQMMQAYAKFLYKQSRFDEANKIYASLKTSNTQP